MTVCHVLHDKCCRAICVFMALPIDLQSLQDELLGLAADPEKGYLADQIDPTVLLRQREDRQVGDGLVLEAPTNERLCLVLLCNYRSEYSEL